MSQQSDPPQRGKSHLCLLAFGAPTNCFNSSDTEVKLSITTSLGQLLYLAANAESSFYLHPIILGILVDKIPNHYSVA